MRPPLHLAMHVGNLGKAPHPRRPPITVDRPQGLGCREAEQRDELHEREHAHGHEPDRFVSHAVFEDRVDLVAQVGLDVAREGHRLVPPRARGAHRLDDVRAATALRDKDLERIGRRDIQALEFIEIARRGEDVHPNAQDALGEGARGHTGVVRGSRRDEAQVAQTTARIALDQAAHKGIYAGEVLLEHPRRHLDIGFHSRLGVAHGTQPPYIRHAWRA